MKSILICIVLSYVLLAGAGALKNPSFESKVPLEWKSGVYIPAERSEERASAAGQVFCSPETRQVK